MLTFDFEKSLEEKTFHFKGSFQEPIISVIGKSGAGKTTLARCLAGFETPDSGYIATSDRILYDSKNKINLPVHRRGIGFVFQSRRLLPHLSVESNILLSARWAGHKVPENFQQILDTLEISDLLKRSPDTLSGGQAQRVEIARAIVASDDLLIMDEPLSGLDPNLSRQTLSCISKLPSVLDIQILYITHHRHEALMLSDTTILIHQGQIVFVGDTNKALSHPIYKGESNEIHNG